MMHPPALRGILAATDLTEGADAVIRGAAALATLTGAELHVLHALELHTLPYLDPPAGRAMFDGWIEAAAEALNDQVRRSLPPHVTAASSELMLDSPHRAILRRAGEVAAELIVLGPHRLATVTADILGTTADRVVRTAEVPCLILREPLALPLRRVVVPIDLSEPARGALDRAIGWARAFATPDAQLGLPSVELRVIHIIPRLARIEGTGVTRAVVGPQLSEEVAQALERCGAGSQIELCEEVLWGDDPAEEILRYAQEEHADLLVLGTHGYGAVRRMLIGSVASAIARRIHSPLLLVPPRLWRATTAGARSGMDQERAERRAS